jgi:CheY-like chemotaxis protein
VLLNLCINARDAMPDGGRLTISAKSMKVDDARAALFSNARAGDYVLIEVADTGTGIPPAIINKIFDPFFTTKEPGKGTGLGLSMVLGIVKSHGGFLNVESEPGKGTTFQVFLPVGNDKAAPPRKVSTTALPQGNGESILVVDDEAEIRKLLETILTRNGYHVILASDGNEALKEYVLQAGAVKLVLTDVMMPWVDGVVLTRALRKIDPAVKVIASTGQPELSRVDELMALGVKAFLGKPYNAEKLLVTVDTVLKGKVMADDTVRV